MIITESCGVLIFKIQLRTVTYGLNNYSFLAIRVLPQLDTNRREHFLRASTLLTSAFCINDLATGGDTLEETKTLEHDIICLLAKGVFELQKLVSNHQSLLAHLPAGYDGLVKIMCLIWYANSVLLKIRYLESDMF